MKIDLKQTAIPALFVGMLAVIALSRAGTPHDAAQTYPQALVSPKNMTVIDRCYRDASAKDFKIDSRADGVLDDERRCVIQKMTTGETAEEYDNRQR